MPVLLPHNAASNNESTAIRVEVVAGVVAVLGFKDCLLMTFHKSNFAPVLFEVSFSADAGREGFGSLCAHEVSFLSACPAQLI